MVARHSTIEEMEHLIVWTREPWDKEQRALRTVKRSGRPAQSCSHTIGDVLYGAINAIPDIVALKVGFIVLGPAGGSPHFSILVMTAFRILFCRFVVLSFCRFVLLFCFVVLLFYGC